MIDSGKDFPDIGVVFIYPILIADTAIAVGGHRESEPVFRKRRKLAVLPFEMLIGTHRLSLYFCAEELLAYDPYIRNEESHENY